MNPFLVLATEMTLRQASTSRVIQTGARFRLSPPSPYLWDRLRVTSPFGSLLRTERFSRCGCCGLPEQLCRTWLLNHQ